MKEKGKLYHRTEYVEGVFGGEQELVILCTEDSNGENFSGVIVRNDVPIHPEQTVGYYSTTWNSPRFYPYREIIQLGDDENEGM